MIFQHSRFQVWNQNQHPFLHNISDFAYSNDSLPGTSNIETALDYIIAVLFPNSKPAVATPAALPAGGNSINDYRVVTDDGDGKAASYRWYIKEGTAAAAWHKVLDLDWGTDSILQAWQNTTIGLYVMKNGYDDIDEVTGLAIAGTLAGQQIFGGATAGSNLTLSANSGDAAGAGTGFVQFTDQVRPTVDGTINLGTTGNRFLKGWFGSVQAGTLLIAGGSISDSSGTISFANENLTTSGTMTAGTLVMAAGSITDTSGAISFGNENLTTTGTVTADHVVAITAASQFFTGTSVADFTFTNGNIASASATVSFNALNLTTTGTITGGLLNIDNVRIDANTISATNANGDLTLAANGTGNIQLTSPTTSNSSITIVSANFTVSNGTSNLTGILNIDNLRLDGNTLSATDVNGSILLTPNGTGQVSVSSVLFPATTASYSLGKTAQLWNDLWLSSSFKDGTNTFLVSEFMALRSANFRDAGRTLPAQSGDALFFDGTQWLASVPDSEISHGSLTGLTTGDAGHTQFALLAGRAGGQSLIGGTATGENLNLESTAHATKGFIQLKDTTKPFADSVYSAGWTGVNLGSATFRFNNLYTAGEAIGLRLENLGALPSSSSQKVGRLVYYTGDENVYVDTGLTVKQVGGSRFYVDTVWNGSDVTKNVTVSGTDARLAVWQLKDNTNDFETIYCSLKATSATNILITVGSALPAASYRLVGV